MRAEQIEQLLPDVIRRTRHPGGTLDVLLAVMEDFHDPIEALLADFARHVDPHRCPVDFVPYLATWVGLDWLLDGSGAGFPTGDGPLRDVIANAQRLATARGTADGLRDMLELATSTTGIEVTTSSQHPFHIVVTCPSSILVYHDLVCSIITHEKPVFVTADVVFGDGAPERLGRFNASRPGEEPHG